MIALAVHRQPELAQIKQGTRLKLVSGETLSRAELEAARLKWGGIIAYMDVLERSVTRTVSEVLDMPAKYMHMRALAGFNPVSYQQESTAFLLRAVFGGK